MPITEAFRRFIERLRANDQMLTSINLGWHSIGVGGARALAEALKVNQTLTSIDLGHNSIGTDGAQALADALRENYALTLIKLVGQYIDAAVLSSINRSLRRNQILAGMSKIACDRRHVTNSGIFWGGNSSSLAKRGVPENSLYEINQLV